MSLNGRALPLSCCFLPFPRPDVCAHEVVTLNIHKDDVSESPGRHQRPAAVGGPRFPSCYMACMLLLWKDAPRLVWPRKWTNASGRIGFVMQLCAGGTSVFRFLAFTLVCLTNETIKSTTKQPSSFGIFLSFLSFFYLKHSHLFDSFFLSRMHTRLC